MVEGVQRIRSIDLEVEVMTDSFVADDDLHSAARAIPEKCDLQPVGRSRRELDPPGIAPEGMCDCGAHHVLLLNVVSS
jgi:hypothetical protein